MMDGGLIGGASLKAGRALPPLSAHLDEAGEDEWHEAAGDPHYSGWLSALRRTAEGNAIALAKTPVDRTVCGGRCPIPGLPLRGMDVGLPAGQMGNSEVGHTNIGAGRVVYQELTRITRAAQNGELEQNPALSGRPWSISVPPAAVCTLRDCSRTAVSTATIPTSMP